MENFKTQVEQVVALLKKTSVNIENIMSDDELMHLRNRLLRTLEREISTLSLQHGIPYEGKEAAQQSAPPLTKLFGRVIGGANSTSATSQETQLLSDKPEQANLAVQSAEEVEAAEFKQKTLDVYAQFGDMTDEAILDQLEEMVIRGVGKLAGLPVTEDTPKKVDMKFIQQIKDAIKQKGILEEGSKKLPFDDVKADGKANNKDASAKSADKK